MESKQDLNEILEKQIKYENEKNILNKYNEIKQDVIKEIKSRQKFIGEWLITIAFMLITLVIIGLPTLFTMGWDWSIYASSSFWINYFTVQFASWFSRVWILLVKTRQNKMLNVLWIKTGSSIQKYVEQDTNAPFINYNCEITNRERKIRVYKNKQKLKVLKLSMKYKIENILNTLENTLHSFTEPFKIKSGIITHKENKRVSKRLKRRLEKVEYRINQILQTLSDDYIKTNLDNIKVKYNKVSRTILTNGYAPSGDINEIGYSYKKKTTENFLQATLPMFLFVSAIMFLIVPLLGDMNKDWNSWYKFITNMFLVIASAGTMWYSADEIFNKTELRVLIERDDTLREFSKNPQPQIKVEPPKTDVKELVEQIDEIEKKESTQ